MRTIIFDEDGAHDLGDLNCSACDSGKRSCAEGNPNRCSNPIARNH